MKLEMLFVLLAVNSIAALALEQEKAAPSAPNAATMHSPPPQAYEDCKNKKSGDTIQHTTPEGKVAAICIESPRGLVARPTQPKGAQANVRKP